MSRFISLPLPAALTTGTRGTPQYLGNIMLVAGQITGDAAWLASGGLLSILVSNLAVPPGTPRFVGPDSDVGWSLVWYGSVSFGYTFNDEFVATYPSSARWARLKCVANGAGVPSCVLQTQK